MTAFPVVEALLVVLAGVTAAWVVSYLLHSTVLIAAAALLTRSSRIAPADSVRVWRFALVAPFLTSVVQVSGPARAPLPTWDIVPMIPHVLVDWRLGVLTGAALLLSIAGVLVGWVAGAIVLRRVLGTRMPAPRGLQEEVAALALAIGCRPPMTTVSGTCAVPAAVGFSEVCVPAASLDRLPAGERRSLLAHELGHLAARDPLWLVITGSLARLTPFQPLNRWAICRMREAGEMAADDFAVRATGDAAALAGALVSLVSILATIPGGAAATGSPLVERVARLMDDGPRATPVGRWIPRAAAVAALALIVVAIPGPRASVEQMADRLVWLAPGKEEPNARMLEVRRFERALRHRIRETLR